MGELIDLNPQIGVIPDEIARDTEVTAAVAAHAAAADPHTQYLLQSEGDARYRQSAVALTDADIPAAIARDTEVTAAVAAHTAAADPHPVYLTQAEGDGRYRQSATALIITAPLPPASVASNSVAVSWNSVQPGFGTAELCNYAGLGGGDAFNFFRVPGAADGSPTISNMVAKIDITGAYFQASDRRLKKGFLPSPGLQEILLLSPKRYKQFECLDYESKKKQLRLGKNFVNKIGFLAQEVAEVIPEAVSKGSDEQLLGIDYSCLVACLVRAVQELQAQIDELKV